MENVSVRVPGKLYISGEYGVLTKSKVAIIVAVDRYVFVDVKKGDGLFQSSKGDFKFILEDNLTFTDTNLDYAKSAIKYAYAYIEHLNIKKELVSISIQSGLDHKDGRKYGLGSSAAVMAGIVKAILKIHDIEINKFELFKLITIAQYDINKMSSGGDLAASIFGGYVFYKRYDYSWFEQQEINIDLIFKEWPKLKIETIPVDLYQIIVGWTGVSQNSDDFINKFNIFMEEDPKYTSYFANLSYKYTNRLRKALINRNTNDIYHFMKKNQKLLSKLTKKTNIEIVSKQFIDMIKIAKKYRIPIKVSGAGYGDCGIGILPKKIIADKTLIQNEWLEIGIEPLNIKVSKEGIYAV